MIARWGIAGASLAMRCASLGLIFATQLLLARTLGAAAFGLFAFALAWFKALSVVATLGTERLVVRDVGASAARGEWGRLAGLVRWVGKTTIGASLATMVAAAALVALIEPDSSQAILLWMALALLPLLAVTRLGQNVVTGLRRPLAAQVPELVLQPLLFLALVATAALLGLLGARTAMGLQLAAAAGVALCAAFLLHRSLPPAVRQAMPEGDPRKWRRSMAALVAVTGAMALSATAPVLLLGLMRGPEAAGVMAVAKSLADLAGVPAAAFMTVLAPLLATQWAQEDRAGVQRNVTSFARAASAVTAAVAVALAVLHAPLLGLFGPGFAAGGGAVLMLLGAQVVSALTGSNALLLTTAGHEGVVARVSLVSTAAGIGLTAALIPGFGLEGAAAGTAAGAILWNLWLAGEARRLTRIRPTVFAPD